MDLSQHIYKTLQIRDHIYCIRQKPYVSFHLSLNHFTNGTNFYFSSKINHQKEKGWINHYYFITQNKNYPKVTLYLNPFQAASLNFATKNYEIKLSPNGSSALLNFYQKELSYSLKAYLGSPATVIGNFKINNRYVQSICLWNNNFSFNYKLIVNKYLSFLAGLMMKRCYSINEALISHFFGCQFLIFDRKISITQSFVFNNFELALHHRKGNHRQTFVWKCPENSDPDSFYLQYKWSNKNGRKIGFLCEVPKNVFYVRGSLKISEYVKLKMTSKMYQSEGEFHFEPTFGTSFQLF